MESTKQLDKSPLMSAGSLEGDMSVRPPQHTETRRSQHCEDASTFKRLFSNIRQVFPDISFWTREKEAEERKSFVPEDIGRHRFYSHQYKDPEPVSLSVRRERTDSGARLLTQRSILILESPPESHRSDKREMPYVDGLSQLISATRFNKPEETQGFKRRQKSFQQIWALLLSNPQDSQMSDRKQTFSDCQIQDGASSSTIFYKPEETLDSEEKRKFVADELHPPMSSQPQETDTGGSRQRQMSETSLRASSDLPGSQFRKTSGPAVEDQRRHFASFFFHRAGALPLFLLLFSVMVCSVTGNLCDQKRETLKLHKGEVALVCPVTADVHRTKQSVVIYFVTSHTYVMAMEVLGCDWLSKRKKHDCLQSPYGAQLIEIQADSVLARLPEDRVQQNASYRCQLVPNDRDQPFTVCHLCYPVVPNDTSTTEASTTVDHHVSVSSKDTGIPGSQRPAGVEGLITITVLICIAIILLLILVVLVWNRRKDRFMVKFSRGKESNPDMVVSKSNQRGQQYNIVAQETT